MDGLTALGLRIDDQESLRIMSEETERSSKEIAEKAKLLITNLYDAKGRLDKTSDLLVNLDKDTRNLRIVNLASRISKL